MRRASIAFALAVTLALAGCTGPPPALPKSVLAQGEEALPEKHPKLNETQKQQCEVCHRAVADPAPTQ